MWSRDGRELFFIAENGALMSVRVGEGSAWTAGTPNQVVRPGYFHGNFAAAATYDVSPDGKRFLMIRRRDDEAAATPITLVVVQNWFEELKAKLAAGK